MRGKEIGLPLPLLFFILLFIFLSLPGCGSVTKDAFFNYKGVKFEGFDPQKHHPSPEFAASVRKEKVYITKEQERSLKRCIDLLEEKGLTPLLGLTEKFVVVDCPFSFADKPQNVIYLDKEKVNLGITIGDDWGYKLWRFAPSFGVFSQELSFQGRPELPNLLRIILHELGHLVEYKELKFSWTGKFIANELNREFVCISWNEKKDWLDRESLSLKLREINSEGSLIDFIRWFKNYSSFFSIYAGTGMNEDFAETFVYYYLSKYYNFTLDLVLGEKVIVTDLQKPNKQREKKLKYIARVMEGPRINNH